MITLLINLTAGSSLLELLGMITAILEGVASVAIIIAKAIVIIRSKKLSDQEKIEALSNLKDDDSK